MPLGHKIAVGIAVVIALALFVLGLSFQNISVVSTSDDTTQPVADGEEATDTTGDTAMDEAGQAMSEETAADQPDQIQAVEGVAVPDSTTTAQ